MSSPTNYADILSAISSRALVAGRMQLDWLDGLTTENYGPARAPASPSALPVKARAKRTPAISGQSSLISSVPDGPMSSWENRLRQRLERIGSTECILTWKGIGYACGAAVVPACAVDAPHRRDRLWFVADADGLGRRARTFGDVVSEPSLRSQFGFGQGKNAGRVRGESSRCEADAGPMADTNKPFQGQGWEQRGWELGRVGGDQSPCDCDVADADQPRPQGRLIHPERGNQRSTWSQGVEWAVGADGKSRRVEPGIRLLAHGVPARVGKLHAYGNAIVPAVAAEIIGAYMDIAA